MACIRNFHRKLAYDVSKSNGGRMNYKKSIAHYTSNHRALDKKVLGLKKSWDDVSQLLEKTAPVKKRVQEKNKK